MPNMLNSFRFGVATPLSGYTALYFSHLDTYSDTGLTSAVSANTDPIGGWKNQITGATVHGLQSTSGQRPLVDTSVTLNTFRTIRFNRFVPAWFLFTSLMNGATEGTFIVVVKGDTDGGVFANGLWSLGGGGGGTWYPEGDGVVRDNAGSFTRQVVGNLTPPLTNWHVYAVRTKSAEWAAYLDTNQVFQTSTNTAAFGAGGTGRLGINADPGGFSGNIAAFAWRNAWRGNTDIVADITEIMTFYGL